MSTQIKQIKIKNFKSIENMTIEVPSKPNAYHNVFGLFGDTYVGKSNIFNALKCFYRSVFEYDFNIGTMYYNNHDIANSNNNSAMFEIVFLDNDTEYTYGYHYDEYGILNEWLLKDDKTIFKIFPDDLEFNFESKLYNDRELTNIFTTECFGYTDNHYDNLFLHVIGSRFMGISKDVVLVYRQFMHMMFVGGEHITGKNLLNRYDNGVFNISTNMNTFLSQTTDLLKEFGYKDVSNIALLYNDDVVVTHEINDKSYSHHIEEESVSLKNLIVLLTCINIIKNYGGYIFIDDLDCGINHDIAEQLIDMISETDNCNLMFTNNRDEVVLYPTLEHSCVCVYMDKTNHTGIYYDIPENIVK